MELTVPLDVIFRAQETCPYFRQLEPVEGLKDDSTCLYDSSPCEGRVHCPCGRW